MTGSSDPRPEDRPLHDDVRRLASILGDAIRRLEGEETFQAVESLRTQCRARRRGEAGARDLDQLLMDVDRLAPPLAARVARAFALFFLLINTAEQVHRARRRRQHGDRSDSKPQTGSPRWAMQDLKRRGIDGSAVDAALARLEVGLVLTAHPTEATRRTLLALQSRIASALLARDEAGPGTRRRLDATIRGEVELLWLTDEIRRDRPHVLDEVATAVWYLEDRLMDAAASVLDDVGSAFAQVFGRPPAALPRIVLGSWVGGDRDGNPNVTPAITLAAARRGGFVALRHYERVLTDLVERMSLSSRLVEMPATLATSLARDGAELPEVLVRNARRDHEEPLRLKLSYVVERVRRTRQGMAARDAGDGRVDPAGAYAAPAELERDLAEVESALRGAGANQAAHALLRPLLMEVREHGFWGFRLDVRDDSEVHTLALDDIGRALGGVTLDPGAIGVELLGSRPLVPRGQRLTEPTRRCLELFETIRDIHVELGPDAASTYVVSMTRSPADLLRVLLLAREAGLVDLAASPPRSTLDVVPLFETGADLEAAPAILRELFASPAYRRQLEARGGHQQVMLGYSDSAKDVGMLAAAWALHRAQEEIARTCRDAGVSFTLFHGRGGTVGRGGGSPVLRALSALPPGTFTGAIRITEQGEVVSQKFGLAPIAERSMEVTLAGGLLASFVDWRAAVEPDEVVRFRATMERLASTARDAYRRVTHGDDGLFRLFEAVTPVAELARIPFGSRPTYRSRGAGTMVGMRAIPWVFGWTQIRLMLPAWLGAGTALGEAIAAGDGPLLSRMAATWPFFDDLLGKLEMVCAKADPAIAEAYVRRLGGDMDLAGELVRELERTVTALCSIRGDAVLLARQPTLRAAIDLRNPYVDPLSLIQISLLSRRAGLSGEDHVHADDAIAATVNGIAQGLRNTG